MADRKELRLNKGPVTLNYNETKDVWEPDKIPFEFTYIKDTNNGYSTNTFANRPKAKQGWWSRPTTAGDIWKVAKNTQIPLVAGLATGAGYLPEIIAGGDAVAATTAGQRLTSGLNFTANAIGKSKAWPWINTGLSSLFAAQGADKIRRGDIHNTGDVVETGLDLLPLSQLARPIISTSVKVGNAVEKGAKKFSTLYNSPLTGKWTQIGNKEYRFNPNSLGANGALLESRGLSPWIKELPLDENRYYRQVRPDALDSYKANKVVSQFNEYGNNPTRYEVPMFTKGKPSLYRTDSNNYGDVWIVSKPGSNLEWESVKGAAVSPRYNGEFNKAPISEFEFYQYDPAKGYVKLDDALNLPNGINFSRTPHIDYLKGLSEQQQIEYLTQNGLNDQWLWTLKNNPDHLESALFKAPIPNISTPQITAENAASITPIKAIKAVTTPGKISDITGKISAYRKFKSNTKKYFPSYLTKVPFDSSKKSVIKLLDEEFVPKFDTNIGETNKMYVDEILNRLSDMGIDINKTIPIYDKGQFKMISPAEYARTTTSKPIHVGYHKSQNSPAGLYNPETDEAIIDLNQTYNDFLSSVLHERVIHPTDNIIDGLFNLGVYKPTLMYRDFLDKLFKKPLLEPDKNKILKQISPNYESSKDWWELRATIGEMKKRLLLKKFYDARNNDLNPTTYEDIRPLFIEEIDKMPNEMLGILLGVTNGYGSDYLNFRKNNPNFYDDLRNLLKYGAAYGAPVTVGAGLINNNK